MKRLKSLSLVGYLIFNPHRNKAISGFHWLNRQQQHMIIGLILQSRIDIEKEYMKRAKCCMWEIKGIIGIRKCILFR
jgi:hypothetical protein